MLAWFALTPEQLERRRRVLILAALTFIALC
jgi:hypothetical protein